MSKKFSTNAVEDAFAKPMVSLDPVHTLKGHESLVNSCSFSADGNLVVSSSADGTVRLWHARSGEQLASFEGHDGDMVQNCAFIPASAKLKCASYRRQQSDSENEEESSSEEEDATSQPLIISASDEDIKLWGALDGKEKASMVIDCDGFVQGFALSPDGHKILTNMDDQCIILSAIEGEECVSLEGHEGAAKSFCFSEDGKSVLTSSNDGTVKVWDSGTGEELVTCEGHEESVWKAIFSPDNSEIISCSADKTLRVWARKTGKQLSMLEGHKSPIHLCAMSPNGRWIASASRDKEIRLWDRETESEIGTLKGHEEFIWNIQFSPDSMLLLSTSSDGAMLVWALPYGQLLASLKGHSEGVKSCHFSPRGNALVSSSHDNTLMLWNLSSCYFEAYLDEMNLFLDQRTAKQFPTAVCRIMAEYAWPDCVGDLDIKRDYEPNTEAEDEFFKPAPRRRIKSCKF